MARVASSAWLVRKDALRWVLQPSMHQSKRIVVSTCMPRHRVGKSTHARAQACARTHTRANTCILSTWQAVKTLKMQLSKRNFCQKCDKSIVHCVPGQALLRPLTCAQTTVREVSSLMNVETVHRVRHESSALVADLDCVHI